MKNKEQNFIFIVIYWIVNFFIFVGEITEKVLLIPLYFIKTCLRIPLSFLKNSSKKLTTYYKVTLKRKGLVKIYQWRNKSFKYWPMAIKALIRLLVIGFSYLAYGIKIAYKALKKGFKISWKLILKPFRLISVKAKYFIIGFSICLLLFFLSGIYTFLRTLPSPTNIGKINYALSTHIYDRNGKLLYEIYRDQNRTPIKLKDLPSFVSQATVAIEDKDFYRHGGVSPVSGILRALKEIIFRKNLQGGSTITQQLVKTALLTPERTIERKIREIIIALWAERIYTKDQILEMYLNQVPYGGSAYGVEEAAKIYFDKQASELNLNEAALLAGLPQAPSTYSPYSNPALTLKRRNEVLEKMYEQRYIDKKTKDIEIQKELNIIPLKTNIKAPHFVFYLKNELENQYGIQKVEEGGMNVLSTLDLNIQQKVEEILREEIAKVANLNISNGAVLVTRPQTGEILAMVGSTDYFAQPYGAFNVTTALRQPGSSIKPLMYSLALSKNFTAATTIDDVPVVFQIPGSVPYRPVNYDSKFHGKVTLRYALANSYNIPAVRTLNSLGVEEFINHARTMGISTWLNPSFYGLSLTLGGGEVKMTDMATAFGVFANAGSRVDLSGINKIDLTTGGVLYEQQTNKNKVLDEGIAYIISDILSDNAARVSAFGPKSFLEIPGYKVAVKTGTTDNKKDNWTIGYTPEYLVVVWVGNNDGTPMNPYLASGITGAAPIWNRVMDYLLKNNKDNSWFSKPDDVVEKSCYFGKIEYFIQGTENSVSCRESLFNITPTPTPK